MAVLNITMHLQDVNEIKGILLVKRTTLPYMIGYIAFAKYSIIICNFHMHPKFIIVWNSYKNLQKILYYLFLLKFNKNVLNIYLRSVHIDKETYIHSIINPKFNCVYL